MPTQRSKLVDRLSELGFELPAPERTIYQYVPVSVHERVAFLAGQVPKTPDGLAFEGVVGVEVSLDEAKVAAQICVLQALAWVDASGGGVDNVKRVLRMTCYIAAAPDMEDLSAVADAASALLGDLYGDPGRHPRSVIGVSSLPRRAPVLIELTLALHRNVD